MNCNRFIVAVFALVLTLASCGPDSSDLLPEHTFTAGIEGPATDASGNIYAVNFQEEGTIGKVSPDGTAELFLRLPQGSTGNGIQFDREGNMFIADYTAHRVYRVPKGSRQPEIWAAQPEMNQPNDLCIHPNGSIYLSDPNWEKGSGKLWRVLPDRSIAVLETGMGTTNGITLSPDSRYLYVNESVQRKIWRYTLSDSGDLLKKELFASFEDYGLDGMRCDSKGNLYITRYDKGSLLVLNPEGKLLKEYFLKGKKPSNLTFAGQDGTLCFITMADRGCFEVVTAPFPGANFN